jgi:hypothetical protein
VDNATARSVSLLAAVIARIGTGTAPAQLMAEAAQYVPWITRPPAHMSLAIKGDLPMPLNVDSLNAVAVLSFTDDHEDAVAPPDGTLSTAVSDNTDVLMVGPATAGTDANGVPVITFALTEGIAGAANLSVTSTDANGNALLGPDGVTPIPDPSPVAVTVNPGAAAAEKFTVAGN